MGRWDAKDDIDRPLNGTIAIVDEGGVQTTDGQILAVTGANGPRLLTTLADADSATLRDTVLLIANGTIGANMLGTAHPWRLLRNVNTLGATKGDPVYLSSTAGGWTLTAPVNAVKVGVVTAVSATVGAVLLSPGLFAGAAGLTGGPFTDNRVLRAHGTTGVQDGPWTMSDAGVLTGPGSGDASIVWRSGDLAIIVDRAAKSLTILADGGIDLAANDAGADVSISAGDKLNLTSPGGWTVDAISYTAAQVAAVLALRIGPPICAVRTTEFNVTDTEATITFESVPITSTEITHAAGELTVSATGRYKVEFTGYGTVTTADATESTMTVLMQDDTAAQGSDANTPGTTRLVIANPTNGTSGAGLAITHVIDLDAGDTVRFRADRGDVGGTCRIVCGVVMQRIG